MLYNNSDEVSKKAIPERIQTSSYRGKFNSIRCVDKSYINSKTIQEHPSIHPNIM